MSNVVINASEIARIQKKMTELGAIKKEMVKTEVKPESKGKSEKV